MPAVKQQRKATASSKVKTSQQPQASSISSFARVSKVATANANAKKGLAASTPKKADVKLEPLTPASRKRKVVISTEDDDSSSADEKPTIRKRAVPAALAPLPQSSPIQPVKRGRGRPPKKARPEPTPRKRARSPSVSDSEASAIEAGLFLKKLRLESSPSRCSTPFTVDTSLAGSDSESDAKRLTTKSRELPEEVLSLIDLHAAFLKTLTLHYAHNGSHVPADLRVLCPNVARAWGKKKVTNADIRICLGVLTSSSLSTAENGSQFSLSNYGRGKICVESNQSRTFGPLDENKLNSLFRTNITALWTKYLANDEVGESKTGSAFLAALPKAPVTLCESVAKASPVLLRGQQRLEDLKHGIAIKKQEKGASSSISSKLASASQPSLSSAGKSTTPTTVDTPMTNADGSKMSLLDRIRLKSMQKASLPAGLSAAQLERRAALQRAEEVSSLIGMLSRATGDGSRVSFTMVALLEKLKDSFRMGISKPEGAACVRLLATDVAPEWIRVVTLAGRENVVVEVGSQLGKPEVSRRVQDILAREAK